MWARAESVAALALRRAAEWMWAAQGFVFLTGAIFVILHAVAPVGYAWLTFAVLTWIGSYLRDRRLLGYRQGTGGAPLLDVAQAFNPLALLATGLLRLVALGLLVAWVAVDVLDLAGGPLLLFVAFHEALLSLLLVDVVRAVVAATGRHKYFLAELWDQPPHALHMVGEPVGGFFHSPHLWGVSRQYPPTAPEAEAATIELEEG